MKSAVGAPHARSASAGARRAGEMHNGADFAASRRAEPTDRGAAVLGTANLQTVVLGSRD